jgi:hypothetical protein
MLKLAKNKTILFDRYAMPDTLGYPDKFSIIDKDDKVLLHGFCSTCPNAYSPIASGRKHWREKYAIMQTSPTVPELYGHKIKDHHTYGVCISLNNGGPILTMFPNPNKKAKYYGLYLMDEVFIHRGDSDESTPAGRGSAGCITLPSHIYDIFMQQFNTEETIDILISDKTNFSNGGMA